MVYHLFDIFYKLHDAAVCVVYVSSFHKKCSDVIPINGMAANVSRSSTMVDIEQDLLFLRQVQQCVYGRQTLSKKFDNDISKLEVEIKDFR